MYAKILKSNPYHDETGAFTSKERASNAVGGQKGPLNDFVDLETPLSRIGVMNRKIDEYNEVNSLWMSEPIDRAPPPEDVKFEGLTDANVAAAFSADKVSIYSAMSRATVLKIIEGGELKNSLQTGTGTFKTKGEERAVKEREFLGVKADADTPEGYPKYGFVASKGVMDDPNIVGFGYGSVYAEFKDSIRDRTTATIGDSFNGNGGNSYLLPAPIDNMGVSQLAGRSHLTEGQQRGVQEYNKSGNRKSLLYGAEYVEAQMYGKIDSSHIAAIHIESKKDAKALSAAMRKAGVDIPLVPAKTHTTLSRLNEGYLEDWDKVSVPDLAKLGDSYVGVGWSSGTVGANIWAKGFAGALPKLNLPKTKSVMASYPSVKDVPVRLRREVMSEYITEARRGATGSLPKALWLKPSSKDGFTDDVLNVDLLESYT